MSLESLHLRYAQSLYKHVEKRGLVKKVMNDTERLCKVYESVPALVYFLKDLLCKPSEKVIIIQKSLKGHVEPITLTFLTFLIVKRRESQLYPILKQLEGLYKADQHILKAYVTTPQRLSPSLKSSLTQHLQKLIPTQEAIEVVDRRDPSLLGGYILKIGDQQLDMSIRTQLRQLKAHWDHSYPLPKPNPRNV